MNSDENQLPLNRGASRQPIGVRFCPPVLSAGLLLAFAALLCAGSGCNRKPARTAKPALPPALQLEGANLEAAEKFGRGLAEAISAGDTKKAAEGCDFEALWLVVIQNLDAPKQLLAGAKTGFFNSIQKQPGGLFREAMGREVRLLRVRQREGDAVLLLRLREAGREGASYLDVYLTRGADGAFRARDIFNYALGEKVSDVMARIFAQGVAASSRSPLEKILKRKNAAAGGFDRAMKVAEAMRAGKFAEVLSQSDALPAAVRRERFVQFMRVQAAMALEDDALYLKVLDEMAATFPNDPSLGFILIDRHVLKKDYAKALDAVKLLLADLGNDAFLATIHATCLQELGRTEEAAEAAAAGLKAEPGDLSLLWVHVSVLAAAKRHADVVKVLDEILKLHEQVADPAKAEEVGLAEFFASPEGRAYVARMKKEGNL